VPEFVRSYSDAMNVRDFDDAELLDSLDWNRSVVVRKLEGLTLDTATAVVTPSGVTVLGVASHLAWCERGWFGHFLLGESDEAVDTDESFSVGSASSVDEVVTDYLAGHLDILRELTDGRTGY
jgi:hypothetical protein